MQEEQLRQLVREYWDSERSSLTLSVMENQLNSEGYASCCRLPEEPEFDKYCLVRNGEVKALVRKIYKGKPSREFHLHRDGDKPALLSHREVSYWRNGEYHRDGNRPAYVTPIELCWCVNGKWHRTDGGPTVINDRGIKYHLNHDLYKREVEGKVQYPKGYSGRYMVWGT